MADMAEEDADVDAISKSISEELLLHLCRATMVILEIFPFSCPMQLYSSSMLNSKHYALFLLKVFLTFLNI